MAISSVVATCILGCSSPEPTPDGTVDAGADTREETLSEADLRDASDGEEGERDVGPRSGPLTHLVSDFEFVLERLCDLDGDGDMDNSFADLGSPNSELMTSFMSSVAAGAIDAQRHRFIFHSPWVDDLTVPEDPSTTIITYAGADTDQPRDPTDDFSGEEPFYIGYGDLDPCGEPLYYFSDTSIVDGELSGELDAMPMLLAGTEQVVARGGELHGTLQPGGSRLDMWVCAYGRIGDLGAAPGPTTTDDITILELLLAGGAPMGMPALPGLEPDIDVDGDGLERFVLDEDGKITSCIDGDGSVIDGRACWQDPRMADGVSITVRMSTTTARFGGRQPGWEDEVEGECVDGPPEESVFDPH